MSQMTDPGNLYTRRLEEEYISPAVSLPAGKQARNLLWKCEEPPGTKLKFQVRGVATAEGLSGTPWIGPKGVDTFYETSGGELQGIAPEARYLQYRALFTSANGGEWPVLTSVEVELK